jgi:hypothetical protein
VKGRDLDQGSPLRTELKGEIQRVDSGVKAEIQGLRGEVNDRFAGIDQRFNILFGALVGVVVSHFLGWAEGYASDSSGLPG